MGLTHAVVGMSKDTSVQNNVLVSKDGLQLLSERPPYRTSHCMEGSKTSSLLHLSISSRVQADR
ncbi:MAG: hypothetical protein ABGY24_14605 [bacterium]